MGGKDKIKHVVMRINQNFKPIVMTIKDIPQIIEIYKSYWGTRGLYNITSFIKIIKENLSFALKIENEIIGFCLMDYCPNTKIIEIALLCIKEEYKGHNLGKYLLSYCINYCHNLNIKKFTLHVSTTNIPALGLYTKLGFKVIDVIKNYYHDEDPNNNNAYYMFLNN